MQRRVSVIIPVYNAEKYLARCIESVISQTYKHTEIILVNDGSTDNSGAICDQFASDYDNVLSIQKENGGVSSARNVGLTKVSGDYVCFVDGDDWLVGCMLEYLVRTIEEDKSDMAMCRIKSVSSYENEAIESYETITKYTQDSKQYLMDNFLKQGNSCCAKLFKREQLLGIEFQQGLTIGEDMLFLLQVREKFSKVSVLEFAGYYYLQLPNSAMNKAFKPSFMDEIYCWQHALLELKDNEPLTVDIVKSIIIRASFHVLSKLAKAGNVDNKFGIVCKNAIKDNIAGWRYLGMKEKVQCLLALISVRLYMNTYKFIS